MSAYRPDPRHYRYDLERTLQSVVGLRCLIPADAFTADVLGTEREGSGVIISRTGLVLTIGYLVTEADTVWVQLAGHRSVPGYVVGYDQATGFGLVQILERGEFHAIEIGDSSQVELGERLVIAASGGLESAVASRLLARQEFAGYWEYLLEEALFIAPAHPYWGGTAVIGATGTLVGIGSLSVQHRAADRQAVDLNMVVPIDLLKAVQSDLTTLGRSSRPPRPWLGFYLMDRGEQLVITGLARQGPARQAGLKVGDVVVGVGDTRATSLASLYRQIWSLGEAGVEVPLRIDRSGTVFNTRVKSRDRQRYLRGPVLH